MITFCTILLVLPCCCAVAWIGWTAWATCLEQRALNMALDLVPWPWFPGSFVRVRLLGPHRMLLLRGPPEMWLTRLVIEFRSLDELRSKLLLLA